MKNILTLSFSLIVGLIALSQNDTAVDLNWKIKPGDTLIYETIMEIIPPINAATAIDSILRELGETDSRTLDEKNADDQMLIDLVEAMNEIETITELTTNNKDLIEITLKSVSKVQKELKNADSSQNEVTQMLQNMNGSNEGVMLRGELFPKGNIHSFWVKSEQKNLLAILFELPTNQVKVGDSWELEVNLIGNDQNFICDSSYRKNKVTLTEIKVIKDDTIAVLDYEIIEYVDGTFHSSFPFSDRDPATTMMKFIHKAAAEFSIEQGKWLTYEGVMSIDMSGIMESSSKKRFALIEK